MPREPELEDFKRRIGELEEDEVLRRCLSGDQIDFRQMDLDEIDRLIRDDAAYYFLTAAAGLNRSSLKKSMKRPEVQIVEPKKRKALAVQRALPFVGSLQAISLKAIASRERDLGRKRRAGVESLLRQRLEAEGLPIAMSPPIRRVPGLLIEQRKPDGIYPDPASGKSPLLYLEIKNVRRVADDIQKRLYEIAEVSLEMKVLYGKLKLSGFERSRLLEQDERPRLRKALARQIRKAVPIVVAFFICPKAEASKYRPGAESLIDRVFFQEEIEDCVGFLRESLRRFEVD